MFGVPSGLSGPQWPHVPAQNGEVYQQHLHPQYQHQHQHPAQHQQPPLHSLHVGATPHGAPGANFLPPPAFFPGFNPNMPVPLGFNPFATGPLPFAVPQVPWSTANNAVHPPAPSAHAKVPGKDVNAKEDLVVAKVESSEPMDIDDREEGELTGSETNIAHPPQSSPGKKSTSGLGIHLPQKQIHKQDQTRFATSSRNSKQQPEKRIQKSGKPSPKGSNSTAPLIVTDDEEEKGHSSSSSRVALTQLKVQAQGALLSLHAHNIGYKEMVAEGIEKDVMQYLYRGIGVKPTPDMAPTKAPESLPDKPSLPAKPMTTNDQAVPAKPPSVAKVPPTLPMPPAPRPVKEPVAKPAAEPNPSPPSVSHPLPQKPHLPTPSTAGLPITNGTSQKRPTDIPSLATESVGDAGDGTKKLERKDIIAQMLAKKTMKAPQASAKPVPPPEKPKANLVAPLENDKVAAPPPVVVKDTEDYQHTQPPVMAFDTSQAAPSEARQKEISKAQTELAKKRIEALKQQRLSQKPTDANSVFSSSEILSPDNQQSINPNVPELLGPLPPSNDRNSSFNPQHRPPQSASVTPLAAQQVFSKSNVQIPGLFMATSDKPLMNGQQLPTPQTPWYSAHSSSQNPTGTTVDFARRPDASDIRVCELGSRVIIDLSDNESDCEDDVVESGSRQAANQKNVFGQRDMNRPFSSATHEQPSGTGKEYLQSRIQELTEKIQALEKRKRLRQEQSLTDGGLDSPSTESQSLPNTISEKQALEKVQDASKITQPSPPAPSKEVVSDGEVLMTESKENHAPMSPPPTAAPVDVVINAPSSNPVINETLDNQSPTEQLSASLAAAADISDGKVASALSSRPPSIEPQAERDHELRREALASSSAAGSDVMDIDDSVDETPSEPEMTHPPAISHVVNDGGSEAVEAADDTIVSNKQVL